MQCVVHVYVLNEHYSQEYADQHNGGKDSELNRKYDWEDELLITSTVQHIEEIRSAIYPLKGQFPSGESFEFPIANMLLFDIQSEGQPSTIIGASEEIVDHFSCDKTNSNWVVSIFLKDYEPMANPIPGIYIASKSFPTALITE
jgi:hypothetical protein